jgi:hypothetical protein
MEGVPKGRKKVVRKLTIATDDPFANLFCSNQNKGEDGS